MLSRNRTTFVGSYRLPSRLLQASCASRATASTMSTVRSSLGLPVARPEVATGVVVDADPPPSIEKKSTPVNILRSATTMKPPIPSGIMAPPDAPRLSSMLPLSPADQRIGTSWGPARALAVPVRLGCKRGSGHLENAFHVAVGKNHGRLPLDRLEVAARKGIARFGRHQQLVHLLEQRPGVGLCARRVRRGHVVDPDDDLG